VDFGQIYALFLVSYKPCFWLKYTPKRRFWKTRRVIQGVLFWAYYTGRIFSWIRAVSLCADVRFFGLAQRMGALAAGFLFLLGADWSGALVRPGFAGPWRLVLSQMAPSHMRWGRGRCARVMGAYSAACPQRLM
jgi:hypothetical protein